MDAVTGGASRQLFLRGRTSSTRASPLDQIHRKSLSIPSPDELEQLEVATNTQTQSPLFGKLPTEIRQAIFEEAGLVRSRTIHLFLYEGRVHGKLCTLPLKDSRPYYEAEQEDCQACSLKASQVLDTTPRHFQSAPRGNSLDKAVLALLQTCRRIYSEAIPTLYSTNEFSFSDLWSLLDFLATIPVSHSNKIRSIRLTWALVQYNFRDDQAPYDLRTWNQVWTQVSNLEGLRKLHIELSDSMTKRLCGNLNALPGSSPSDDPKEWWMRWLSIVKVVRIPQISGFICCRFEKLESIHAEIENRKDGRYIVFADGTEEGW